MNHRKLSIQKYILRVIVFSFSLLSLLLVFSPAEWAQAAGKEKTVITIDIPIFGGPETFTATGGVVCPSGTAVTLNEHNIFNDPPAASTFHLEKTLTCDDGSGTFTIKVQAKALPGAPTDSGGWAVIDGTGAYEDLHGGGSLIGTLQNNGNGIIDVYTGMVMD